jgi:uncharacterized protein (TIGR02996 family)
MSTDEAFLRDVCEHPDDDTPRLVYADWLEDHGQAGRAEFIRVECELERTEEYGPRWRQLSARQLALIRAHKKEWVKPFQGWTHSVHFRRGFVESVLMNLPRFRSRAAELFRLAPVREVNFTRLSTGEGRVPPADMEALAAVPELRRARSLGFARQFLGDAALQAFLNAADLRNVERLSLDLCQLTTPGIEALVATPGLAGQTTLSLSNNFLGDAPVAALLRDPPFLLRALDLARTDLTNAGARALAAAPALSRLRDLALWGNPRLTDVGFRALVESPHLAALTHLRCGAFSIVSALTDASLRALAQSPRPPRLATLDLEGAQVGDLGVAALADYPHLDALRRLNLAKGRARRLPPAAVRITDEGARVLAALPQLAGLRWLNLENNALTDAGAQALLASPYLAGLGHLNLKGTPVSPETQRAFRKRYGPGVCTFSR